MNRWSLQNFQMDRWQKKRSLIVRNRHTPAIACAHTSMERQKHARIKLGNDTHIHKHTDIDIRSVANGKKTFSEDGQIESGSLVWVCAQSRHRGKEFKRLNRLNQVKGKRHSKRVCWVTKSCTAQHSTHRVSVVFSVLILSIVVYQIVGVGSKKHFHEFNICASRELMKANGTVDWCKEHWSVAEETTVFEIY